MGWLGLDDTDTVSDGCTTYTLHCLLESLPEDVEASIPSLVRLWPFAQQRTRGNAAVAVELTTNDEHALLTFLEEFWNEHLQPLKGGIGASEHEREQSPTDPGMVWFREKPDDASFYFDTVQRHVSIEEAPHPTRSWGGQGCIGAIAAVVWPKHSITWEAIAWREETQWSSKARFVCQHTLGEVATNDETFMSRDPRTERSLISPRGTCPVLFGVRAKTQANASSAGRTLASAPETEPIIGMRVFATNQASDDHLKDAIESTVRTIEVLSRGTTKITTEHGDWLAFAQSGNVKLLAQSLHSGDCIAAFGLEPEPGVLHIEKLSLRHATPMRVRPTCSECQRTMKSMGTGQGVRCPKCKNRSPDAWIEVERQIEANEWVEPPVDARRHLARPLAWYIDRDPINPGNG
jgi:tRNA(Ile2)-agmatinylcytidine synthase